MTDDQDVFTPHSSNQDAIIFSDAELTIVATGTQFGKSIAGALWLKRQCILNQAKNACFLMLAPSYKIMQQSMIQYAIHYLRDLAEYQKSDALFKLHTGVTIYCRTGTDPDSVVGIPRTRAYWLDEAGKATLYFWENIKARAASVGAKGLLTTSPYSRNWLYKDFIKPKLAGRLPDITLIRAASWENPYHTLHDPAAREKMRSSMDVRRFDMLFGGEWGKMAGLVYDCWSDEENVIEAHSLPQGTRYYGGIDWGFTDPFVLLIRAITPDGKHYGVSEFYKTGLTVSDMIQIAKQKKQVFGVSLFYADPSQPGHIEEFNRSGLSCLPADNDIRRGIDLHYELIKTRAYKEFAGACPHSSDERESYHYPEPEDLRPDQNAKEIGPVDQTNHAMDASRYLTIMTYRTNKKLSPSSPEDRQAPQTVEQRLAMLKRLRSRSKHTENFS